MRRGHAAIAGLLAVAWTGPPLALALQSDRPRIAIDPRSVVFGATATVDATLVGGPADADTPVALLERRLPGDGTYRELDRARADAQGSVSFAVQPSANAYYAVRTRAEPVQTSLGLLVRVHPQVEVTAPASVPRRSSAVRISGTITPAVGAAAVTAQRRDERRWRTVATATARDGVPADAATGSPGSSAYEVAFRAGDGGRYRVVVAATDSLSRGTSQTRRIRVVAVATG
jgi:hypothetical protein